MQILKNDFTLLLQIVLEMLREMFSQGSKATKNEGVQIDENPGMKGCLEWMHEMLIGLVANLLDGMKPKDKLIIVAPEVCNSVYDDAKSWSQSLVCFDFNSRHLTLKSFMLSNKILSKVEQFTYSSQSKRLYE
jgi:hypothetical protein